MNPNRRFHAGRFRTAILAGMLALLPVAMAEAEPFRVVASFSVLGDMVREIGGDDVSVDTLVGPDGDAHTYEPTPSDVARLGAAQLLVINGMGFEAWLPRLLKSSEYAGSAVVASRGVEPRLIQEADDDHDEDHGAEDHGGKAGHHHHGRRDPHAWQSLVNGERYVRNIAEGLAQADPVHAEGYRTRARIYVERLRRLDAKVRQALAAIPAERRKVVTSHDAFGYFGDAYCVRFIPVAGMSTEAEPSAAELAALVRQVRKEGVPAVFVENIQNPRLVEQVARETGARVGGRLYSDALAQPGEPAGTYVGMFEWNLRQLTQAMRP